VQQFLSLDDARAKLTAWQRDYNEHRPHSALGHLTTKEFTQKRQDTEERSLEATPA